MLSIINLFIFIAFYFIVSCYLQLALAFSDHNVLKLIVNKTVVRRAVSKLLKDLKQSQNYWYLSFIH